VLLLQSNGQLVAVSFLSNEQTASPQTARSLQSFGQLVTVSVPLHVPSPHAVFTVGTAGDVTGVAVVVTVGAGQSLAQVR
jgi:hypothetical protein